VKGKKSRAVTPKQEKVEQEKSGKPDAGHAARKRDRLAISRPKKGASGKTGGWRTFRPVINPEECSKCGLCSLYCPEAAISEDLKIDYDFCKGCGICAEECPKKAIRMEREER
jgi:pyruvate ferredoxin oxidoreductase delta subunit